MSYLPHTAVAHQLAVHLAASRAVVSNGYPPYGLYEFPPEVGKIPPHRTAPTPGRSCSPTPTVRPARSTSRTSLQGEHVGTIIHA